MGMPWRGPSAMQAVLGSARQYETLSPPEEVVKAAGSTPAGRGGAAYDDESCVASVRSPSPAMWHLSVHGRNQIVTAPQCTMAALAEELGNSFGVERPVVDKTGLTGKYEIRLEATPAWRINTDPQLTDIPVATALQEHLGLKLQPQKEPLEVLVIDRMEKPSASSVRILAVAPPGSDSAHPQWQTECLASAKEAAPYVS